MTPELLEEICISSMESTEGLVNEKERTPTELPVSDPSTVDVVTL